MDFTAGEFVHKACAYLTRRDKELLVFTGPDHDALQIPKGTVEAGETPREAVNREVTEESGLAVDTRMHHLTSDVWVRRRSPPRYYVRHFFHAHIDESRDGWTHTVTGEGCECGCDFVYEWVTRPTMHDFARDLDDYVHLLDDTPVLSQD